MDRSERTGHIIKQLNLFNLGKIQDHEFVNEACSYFDSIKNETLTEFDKLLLLQIANKAGIPHYYDMLSKFNRTGDFSIASDNVGLPSLSALLYESSLISDNTGTKLHKFQKQILDLFQQAVRNRFFLSASTSFGKTRLVYEIINKMDYKNVVLIFPTIALLSENLFNLKEGSIKLNKLYKIHTLSDVEEDISENNNIFIYTPERFLSFLDKPISNQIGIDFIFVDEIYKIDNSYIIDEESLENERDVAYRMSIFYGLKRYSNTDLFLAGPYINVPEKTSKNRSFEEFLRENEIIKLVKNKYEIVKVSKWDIQDKKGDFLLDELNINLGSNKNSSKKARIQTIVDHIKNNNENVIIYCNTKSIVERVAKEYECESINTEELGAFYEHLKNIYHNDWVLIKALEKGVGIHHGVVPKYIQKEIVELFNSNKSGIDVLASTTTITEGVNTTAKNVVIYKNKKGGGKNAKDLLPFDAKNIAGRAGRFMEHYSGRVITLDSSFIETVNDDGQEIEHKNYEVNKNFKEVDFDMTDSKYLDDRQKSQILELNKLQLERGIPDDIIFQFKVISRRHKIKLHDLIGDLSKDEFNLISELIEKTKSLRIDKDGLQVVLNVIAPIVENGTLSAMISNTYVDVFNGKTYSIIVASLNKYLTKGFQGVFGYYFDNNQSKNEQTKVDAAMRDAANLIFNTYKYQLVKYLGVFNLMYKFRIAIKDKKDFDEVIGLDKLLIKLEYNAFSSRARLVSDFGAPNKVVEFFDAQTDSKRNRIKESFDPYELKIWEKVKNLF